MKYHLYDENERHQGCFESVEKLRNFLCDRKYDISCDADLSCTFDYIKHIKWYFEIEEWNVGTVILNWSGDQILMVKTMDAKTLQ